MGELKLLKRFKPLELFMERETGFEPATPSLEGLRSSQLSYSRVLFLIRRVFIPHCINNTLQMVGRGGFEPP
jgi:hypothetical protein